MLRFIKRFRSFQKPIRWFQFRPEIRRCRSSQLAFQQLKDAHQYTYPITTNTKQTDIKLKLQLFSQSEKLQESSKYSFTKQGKLIRPILIITISKIISQQKSSFTNTKEYQSVKLWSALIQVLHIASLIHDDIIDQSKIRRGMQCHHLKFDTRSSIFTGNFLIALSQNKIISSKKVYQFNNVHMYQIYSQIMLNLTKGQLIQAQKNRNFKEMERLIFQYLDKTYYKTASLIAHSLRGAALLMNKSEQIQQICYKIGVNFGIAFQLIDDVLDFQGNTDTLGKQAYSDLLQGNITGPVLFGLQGMQEQQRNELIVILKKKSMQKKECQYVYEKVGKSGGIAKSKYLSWVFMNRGCSLVQQLGQGEQLRQIGEYILQRDR